MFKKLVAIEPVNLISEWEKALHSYANEVVLHPDKPIDNDEIIRRIGDADGVLVSYTTKIDAQVIAACPNLRYIGMCCSLYSPESANVDIHAANERGVVVLGVRDYGDEGVGEYVISELVRLLHGFGGVMWRDFPMELTGLPIGIVGMGTTGQLIAKTLSFFGGEIYYFSRTRKEALEKEQGYHYLPFEALLQKADILCTCLNKNVLLLEGEAFEKFGDGKILVNTSIGPGHDTAALEKWLKREGNFVLGDTPAAIDPSGRLLERANVICAGKSAGITTLAKYRLGRKVIENMQSYFAEHEKTKR